MRKPKAWMENTPGQIMCILYRKIVGKLLLRIFLKTTYIIMAYSGLGTHYMLKENTLAIYG